MLPPWLRGAETDLRTAARTLERHRSAAHDIAWHWYSEHREAPRALGHGVNLLLADMTITLVNTDHDWLELTFDIAWREPSCLTVNAAVEVACRCPQDHNMHQVRATETPVADVGDLINAFTAGTALLTDVLDSGPSAPGP